MSGSPRGGVRFSLQPPRNWLGRVAFVLAVAAIAALAFFFLVVFLIAGAVVAGILLVRWWWLARKLGRTKAAGAIEGEYSVIRSGEDVPGGADQPRVLPRDSNPQ